MNANSHLPTNTIQASVHAVNQLAPQKKLIRRQTVEALTALSRSTIYDRMNAQSPRYDASFPQPIKIGLAAVRWVESEIQAWIAGRIDLSRNA